jgi:predicted esterase
MVFCAVKTVFPAAPSNNPRGIPFFVSVGHERKTFPAFDARAVRNGLRTAGAYLALRPFKAARLHRGVKKGFLMKDFRIIRLSFGS